MERKEKKKLSNSTRTNPSIMFIGNALSSTKIKLILLTWN